MALTAGCVYCNVTRMSFAARCEQNLDRSDLGAGSSSMSSRKSLMTFVFCSHQIKLFSMQSRAYSKQNSLKKHHRALTSRNRCTQAVSGRQSITLKLNTANAVYLHNMHLTTKPLLMCRKKQSDRIPGAGGPCDCSSLPCQQSWQSPSRLTQTAASTLQSHDGTKEGKQMLTYVLGQCCQHRMSMLSQGLPPLLLNPVMCHRCRSAHGKCNGKSLWIT